MQCAKLHLQERSKYKTKTTNGKVGRFCQKRMVNPEHDEDTRWTDIFERSYCNKTGNYDLNDNLESGIPHQTREDLCLSVQNIQFQGSVEPERRPRTSFKYKTLPHSQKHRMFVKQMVNDIDLQEANRSSELSDYFDDYSKYFLNNEHSRPSSGKSSIVLYCLNNKTKENKAIQVDLKSTEPRKKHKPDFKSKKLQKKNDQLDAVNKCNNFQDVNDDSTKITFHKNGKRKSLTISRTESPATVQVIRVDVVCNYSSSSTMSDYEENKTPSQTNDKDQEDQEIKTLDLKKSRFVKKYMLTNTVKTLDQSVSGGKVTLMCKTFKLTNRSKMLTDKKSKHVLTGKNN